MEIPRFPINWGKFNLEPVEHRDIIILNETPFLRYGGKSLPLLKESEPYIKNGQKYPVYSICGMGEDYFIKLGQGFKKLVPK